MSISSRLLTALQNLSKDYYRDNVVIEDNSVKSITITQSLLSTLFFKNTDKEFCPEYVDNVFLKGKPSIANEYMLRGLYFEQTLIGNSTKDKQYKLPKLLNGEHSVIEKRINQQIKAFPIICEKYGIIIKADKSNCQVQKTALYDTIDGIDIYIKGKADFISPIDFGGISEIGVIDLKLTGDLNNKKYWGSPQMIDTVQAQMYSTLFQLPFYYFVFEYKPTMGHKIFPTITRYSSDPIDRNEGLLRQQELFEKIRTTAIIMIDLIRNGTERIPNKNNCPLCPLSKEHGGDCVAYSQITKL